MKARRSSPSAGRAPSSRSGVAHVALLRGVNVGGKNKLAMSDLVALFAAAGAADVRTYIQSGNVVFRAAPGGVVRLAKAVTAAIEREHGLRVPLVVRTAAELERVAGANPFLRGKARADEDSLHVVFLADEPGAAARAALDPGRSPPDEFVALGREIYLRLPNGAARTKLTNAWFDSTLATTSTMRNWRTVLKLVELARA